MSNETYCADCWDPKPLIFKGICEECVEKRFYNLNAEIVPLRHRVETLERSYEIMSYRWRCEWRMRTLGTNLMVVGILAAQA